MSNSRVRQSKVRTTRAIRNVIYLFVFFANKDGHLVKYCSYRNNESKNTERNRTLQKATAKVPTQNTSYTLKERQESVI